MIKRFEYLKLIEEIRNLENISLDEYIDAVLKPLSVKDKNFIKTLYKDVHYLIKDIDKEGENDLAIENDDFVIEDDGFLRTDLKLTGYQSRLHRLSIWLHLEVVKELSKDNPFEFPKKMESFELNFLNKNNYTPEYKYSLDKIKQSLKDEKRNCLGKESSFLNKILDIDNVELKPNIAGIGLNINEIIKKFKK